MNLAQVEKVANAVLYEGYILYPYRLSALKNRQRWNFGVLSPKAFSEVQSGSDAWSMRTECVIKAEEDCEIEIKVRFLHLVSRQIGELRNPTSESESEALKDYRLVTELRTGEQSFRSWQEAVEREVDAAFKVEDLLREGIRLDFSFPGNETREPILDGSGKVFGLIIRSQQQVNGVVEVTAERSEGCLLVRVSIMNVTDFTGEENQTRDEALMRSTVSTHTILAAKRGQFISLIDPPEEFRASAALCTNVGTWPVLAGDDDSNDMMLSSPIFLYDHPQVAAESPGDLCDSTETDELLTLCIMALTDEEKREMLETDQRARMILERTESLPAEQLLKMHGAIRGLRRVEEKS